MSKTKFFEAIVFGISTIGMAYACKFFGDTVLQIALSIFGDYFCVFH